MPAPKPSKSGISGKQLSAAMLKLEQLTRKCFVIARTYWQSSTPADYYQSEREISDAIAECVSEIIRGIDPKGVGRVFVAPNYRGIRGDLRGKKAARSESSKDASAAQSEERAFDFYTDWYGSLAENGRTLTRKDKRYFMPVGFWAYKIYERQLRFSGRGVTLKGFSGWTAEHGFLERVTKTTRQPIFALHFSFARANSRKPPPKFEHGILHCEFPPKTSALNVTEEFRKQLFVEDNVFSKGSDAPKRLGAGKGKIGFPIVESAIDNNYTITDQERRIAEAIFSVFFYSNFRALPIGAPKDWKTLLDAARVSETDPDDLKRLETREPHSFAELGGMLFAKYKNQLSAATKKRILTFKHYYAFLLNPGLDFRGISASGNAALGTLNFYTDLELPAPLIGVIRKHIEAIYHFLRDLEEWEEGKGRGKEESVADLSHELKKMFLALDGRLLRPVTEVGRVEKGDDTTQDVHVVLPGTAFDFLNTLDGGVDAHVGVSFYYRSVRASLNVLSAFASSANAEQVETALCPTGEEFPHTFNEFIVRCWEQRIDVIAFSAGFRHLVGTRDGALLLYGLQQGHRAVENVARFIRKPLVFRYEDEEAEAFANVHPLPPGSQAHAALYALWHSVASNVLEHGEPFTTEILVSLVSERARFRVTNDELRDSGEMPSARRALRDLTRLAGAADKNQNSLTVIREHLGNHAFSGQGAVSEHNWTGSGKGHYYFEFEIPIRFAA